MTWYCVLPFRHAFVDSVGVSACCNTRRYPVSLEQWAHNPNLKALQQELLSGSIPMQCETCEQQELTQGRSLRTDSNNDYGNQIFTDTRISFIDYRSSNICNFKCRSCSPIFSHGIAQEVKANRELLPFHQLLDNKTVSAMLDSKTMSVTDDNQQWIIDNLDQIDRLLFTGGEPTMIPGIKNIIQEVVQRHRNRIQLLITTNASFTDSFWYELTKSVPNLHWTVSIDAVGAAAEIVRHGTKWHIVESNVRWLAQNATSLNINTVVTNLNVFQLQPLLKFAKTMNMFSIPPMGRHGDVGCRHQFSVCNRPYYLSADNWPDDLKTQAVEYLTDCLALDLDNEQHSMVTGLRAQIASAQFDLDLWERTQQYNSTLDTIRSEDYTALYTPNYAK